MAAYAISFPHRKLSVLIGLFPITAPAIVIIFGYAFIETIYAIFLQTSHIAHSAHIGGFLAGILIGFIFKKIKTGRIFEENYIIKPINFLNLPLNLALNFYYIKLLYFFLCVIVSNNSLQVLFPFTLFNLLYSLSLRIILICFISLTLKYNM
jgi:hypothetical protein